MLLLDLLHPPALQVGTSFTALSLARVAVEVRADVCIVLGIVGNDRQADAALPSTIMRSDILLEVGVNGAVWVIRILHLAECHSGGGMQRQACRPVQRATSYITVVWL